MAEAGESSPYMGFLRVQTFSSCSASPEIARRAGKMASWRLGRSPVLGEDAAEQQKKTRLMAEELLGNEKERAEHIMLVDLERNDLGRIAAYGSVTVSRS